MVSIQKRLFMIYSVYGYNSVKYSKSYIYYSKYRVFNLVKNLFRAKTSLGKINLTLGEMASLSRKRLSLSKYLDGITTGDHLVLSQAVTLIESSLAEDQGLARDIMNGCLAKSGNSIRIGITGVPGVGKSTFIEKFGLHLISQGRKVAVLAIDPTSQKSGGSIMGDKTRMENLARENNSYIRPTPTGKNLGGVAASTRESAILCEAAGFDIILIETVGVGQTEISVSNMVDFFMLLMLPGSGDDLQGIKRGIMELADLVVITKADGAQKALAKRAQADFSFALHLFPSPEWGWSPKVMASSARDNIGIEPIWEKIQSFRNQLESNGHWQLRRQKQNAHWLQEAIQQELNTVFYNDPNIQADLKALTEQVSIGQIPVREAARKLLQMYQS